MVRWYHQLSEHELGQIPGDSEGQETLVCCSPEAAESDTTERQNNSNEGYARVTAASWIPPSPMEGATGLG